MDHEPMRGWRHYIHEAMSTSSHSSIFTRFQKNSIDARQGGLISIFKKGGYTWNIIDAKILKWYAYLVWPTGSTYNGRAFCDIHYGEIIWFCLLLDIYLLGDRLGDQTLNGRLIGRSLWRPDWCCFPCSLVSPLVQEIWS